MRCLGKWYQMMLCCIVALILDEVVFDFEVFPLMVSVSQKFNVDGICCVNRGNIIDKGLVRAYLYKGWFSLLANFMASLFIFILLSPVM